MMRSAARRSFHSFAFARVALVELAVHELFLSALLTKECHLVFRDESSRF